MRHDVKQLRRPRWDSDEQHGGEEKGDDDRADKLPVRDLLIVLSRHLRRVRQRLDTVDERLDKGDRPAQKRLFEDGEPVEKGDDVFCLDLDFARRRAHRRCDFSGAAHHHALDDRLPADADRFFFHVSPRFCLHIPLLPTSMEMRSRQGGTSIFTVKSKGLAARKMCIPVPLETFYFFA